ncbi:MAG TPA: ABC transporter ATP-binding protein [Acidimicrobiales bacterium]|nr:ABC transporter ATP-binding protein [Acidimicrobiales bacterium]
MALLEAKDLNVRFGAHHAVVDVSLAVDTGQIIGLIGPNGAGKTTTFNAVTGVQTCTGSVHLDGVDISGAPAHRRARLGINRTFQRLEVFGSMTSYDNVLTAAEITARAHRRPLREAVAVAADIVELLGLGEIASQRADSLPTGQARLVELGRALATSPKVVLLDEPASGLDEHETAHLAEVLTGLTERGTALLLVEHDVDLVMRLCREIYVLDFGQVIAHGTPDDIRGDTKVQDAYLGAVAVA